MMIDGAKPGIARRPNTTARNKILPLAAAVVALTLQAPSSASVNTQEWKNTSAAVVASVDKDGKITAANLTLTSFSGVLKATAGVVAGGATTSDLSEGSNLYYTDERVDDRVAVLIQNGTGITWSYNDALNTLTPTVTYPGSFSGFANPSASIGLTANNGTATTAMRSDATPALSVSISPTWSGTHTFSNAIVGSVTGNAATATVLATARNINGTSFNGSADITVTAAAGTLTGATLAANVLASSLTSVGTLATLTVTAAIVGSVTGNAATATALQTARTINTVTFNGTADIVVTAAAGTLTGATLNSTVTASSLTSVGTLTALTVSGTTTLQATLNVEYNNASVKFGNGVGTASVVLNGAAGSVRNLQFNTSGDSRWVVRANGTAESGSNAGSNFEIEARDDAATLIDKPLTIARVSGGTLAMNRPVTMSSTLVVTSTIGASNFSGTSSGANTGDQTITLTGDVTGTGTGSFAATIGANKVTLAQMATLAANSIIGNNTAGAVTPIALSTSQVKTLLSLNLVENTALSTWTGATSVTTLGTITTGTWTGTTIAVLNGGTGVTTKTGTGSVVLSAAPALTGTTTCVALTASGVLTANLGVVIGGGTDVAGKLYFRSDFGIALRGNTASSYDLSFLSTAGAYLFRNPTGTNNLELPAPTTMFDLLATVASATGTAGFRLPHGAAPTSPVNGDMWTTTAGLFVRINGVTKTVTLT